MPELPEVETMRRSLLPLCNQEIIEVKLNKTQLRKPINSTFINDIKGTTLKSIERFGKFLLFHLSNNICLLMHAGMSGKFKLEKLPKTNTDKHNHIEFYLNNQLIVYYNDPRRFGLALTFPNKEEALNYINIGIDALDPLLTPNLLYELLQKSRTNIKTFLLNQKYIAGIGNIYACEILFYSHIHPLTATNHINKVQSKALVDNTLKVLQQAITMGGSTLKDYATPSGESGYFQHNFAVYNKISEPCPNCKAPIVKIKIAGRSTFLCPKEQGLKQ